MADVNRRWQANERAARQRRRVAWGIRQQEQQQQQQKGRGRVLRERVGVRGGDVAASCRQLRTQRKECEAHATGREKPGKKRKRPWK